MTHTVREASGPYVPGAQERQIEAPAREYVTVEQGEHTELAVAATAAENVPAVQLVHAVAPPNKYVPAVQVVQTEAPAREYAPMEQEVHAELAVAAEKFPETQFTHATLDRYVPGPHDTQVPGSSPVQPERYCPAPQTPQVVQAPLLRSPQPALYCPAGAQFVTAHASTTELPQSVKYIVLMQSE